MEDNNKIRREKLRLCDEYRKKIYRYLLDLDTQLREGRISYHEHHRKEARFLRGKSEREWYDYLQQCEIKLRNREYVGLIGPREQSIVHVNFIVIIIAILGILLATRYTGLVVFGDENTVIKDVNLEFVNGTSYNISLDYMPSSLKVSGSYNGNGNFRLYLEDKGNILLIVNKEGITGNLITGNAVLNQTEQNITTSIFENLTTTSIQNLTTTILNTTTTIIENITTTIVENITTTVIQSLYFSNVCVETCQLDNISMNLRLIAIMDDGILNVSKIAYTYVSVADLTNVTNVENITIEQNVIQLDAEVNKPVEWIKEVNIRNDDNEAIAKDVVVDLPDNAENIKINGQQIVSVSVENKTYTIDVSLMPNDQVEYNISYETPAPSINEEDIDNGKRVVISSDVHYENVLAYVNVDEVEGKIWKVYWIRNGQRIIISNVNRIDTDNDGKIDRIEWIVPGLSDQIFEILAESTISNYIVDLKQINVTLAITAANFADAVGNIIVTGDLNNDTVKDILIGAPFRDPPGGNNAGEVYLIYGRNYTDKKVMDLAIVSANLTIRGANASDNLGTNKLAFNDINNDKIPDIIVSAPFADPPGGGDGAGEVFVIYGSKNYANGKIIDLNNVTANITIRGANASDRLGIDMTANDINNDGIADLIIGASAADPPGGNGAGEVYVIYGKNYANGKIIDLNTVSANITIRGANASDSLGLLGIASGDINNDGIADIIASAGNADPPGGNGAGEVYVIYGKNYDNGKIIDLNTVSANITIRGANASDSLGSDTASGDINNDGIADLIIGASAADPPGGNGAGEVYVIYGKNYDNGKIIDLNTVSANITIRGNNAGDDLGGNTVVSGDINNDGIADIIASAGNADPPGGNSAGEVYVIYGKNYDNGKIIDLNTVSANITIRGGHANDDLGVSLAIANINNLTGNEIIIGAAQSFGGVSGGSLFVFHGNEVAPILRGNNTVNDTTPIQGASLKCISGYYFDGNYDNLFKSYWKWYKNDAEVLGNKTQQLNLTEIDEEIGDLIKCSQKVSDGYLNSSWYNSSAAQVAAQPSERTITGGGGGRSTAFERRTAEIITPEPLTLELEDSLSAPIKIRNNRDIPLRGITISAKASTPDLSFSFTQSYIDILPAGQEITINMFIESHSTPGNYAVDITLNVTNPKYSETVKLFIDLIEKNAFNKTVIVTRVAFAKDLFKENPECLELDELLVRAEEKLEGNDIEEARRLTEDAVRGCRDLVTAQILPVVEKPGYRNNLIFIISFILAVLVSIIVYYIYNIYSRKV